MPPIEQLEQARKRARETTRRIVFISLAALVLVGIIVSGVIKIDLSPLGRMLIADEKSSAPQVAETQTPPVVKPEPSNPVSAPQPQNQISASPPAQAQTPPPVTSGVTPLPAKSPSVDDQAALKGFKDDLSAFESSVEPRIVAPDFAVWDAAKQKTITRLKDKALQLFSTGDYGNAAKILADASDQALQSLTKRENAYNDYYKQAASSYKQNDVQAARVAIENALRLKPDNQQAKALQGRIDALPETLKLIDEAVVARAENNPEKELKALRKVVENAPSRSEYKARLRVVESEIREQKFARYTASAFQDIEKRDLKSAQKNLTKARAIFQDRSEISLLDQGIKKLGKELQAEKYIRLAEQAATKQDWQQAETYYEKASAVYPRNKTVIDGLVLAKKINALNDVLEKALGKPERLSTKSVREKTRSVLKQANGVKHLSKSLALRAGNLTRLIDAYATDVTVMVTSDGLTDISVRRVGQVGLTKGRNIHLKPGRYVFEGKRDGYQSKQVKVDIPPGAKTFNVTVIADEPI